MDTRIKQKSSGCWQHGLRLSAIALLLAFSSSTMAAISFQLDGNALKEPGSTGEDWSDLNATTYSGPAGARTGLRVDRPEPPDGMHIFTTGGAKDQQPISEWAWRTGSPPAKDDLSHAFAAQYIDTNGDKVLLFGMDRYDTNGDAQLGFWFFTNGVAPMLEGQKFQGEHATGDTLVLVNFSNGGDVPTIEVWRWVGNDATGTLEKVTGGQHLCSGAIPGAGDFCGITNSGPTPAPWPYMAKGGPNPTPQFPRGAFFEGAINLGNNPEDPCFTNFLAESRSSTSITATLKDFVSSSFPACRVSVTKNCSEPSLTTDNRIQYTITGQVTNEGGGAIHGVDLSDDPVLSTPFAVVNCATGVATGTNFPLVSLAKDGIACYSNTFTVPLAENGPSDVVTVSASATAGGAASITASDDVDCTPIDVGNQLTIIKTCETEAVVVGNQVVVQVNATATVCNRPVTGKTSGPVSGVTVTDNKAGTLTGPTTLALNECKDYTGTYIPEAPDAVNGAIPTDPSDVRFTDRAEVNANDILGNAVTSANDSATCPLCVCPDCPTN